MAELKSCPFCGGEASARKTYKGTFAVSCNRICVGQYGYDTEEEAIEAWNTRKPMEAVVAELEKTKNECEPMYGGRSCGKEAKAIYEMALSYAISIVRGKE